MAQLTMTTRYKFLFSFILIIFFSFSLYSAEKSWVIGAEKFSLSRNQTDSVTVAITRTFPERILEKINTGAFRTIPQEEKAERELYSLKNERNSLFLQLSSETKKRDNLVTGKYSQNELNKKISEQEKKIQEIKTKLSQNLEKQEELTEILNRPAVYNEEKKSFGNDFIKNLFSGKETQTVEQISVYKNDITALFSANENEAQEYSSEAFQKKVMTANINCLLTGKITAYDEYMALTVEAFVYPGAKSIFVYTEIGSINDMDFMAETIARQFLISVSQVIPSIIKVQIDFDERPESLKAVNPQLYIDDILYTDFTQNITVDSGVHYIQFVASGYKSAGTNYYFAGNSFYDIQVTLLKEEEKILYIQPYKEITGSFLLNGLSATALQDGKSKIKVNGNSILGQFITEDKDSAFIFIPEENLVPGALYTAKMNPVNHNDYIEKSRRRMYTSYSVLVTSLIPAFITRGMSANYISAYDSYKTDSAKIKKVNQVILTSNICTGISIGCGIWFVYELYRYFTAANSVLPVEPKYTLGYIEPVINHEETESNNNLEDINESADD